MQQIIKKADLPREPTLGGTGEQKVYLTDEIHGSDLQAMVVSYLPSGSRLKWHRHVGLDETMYVIAGYGVVLCEERKMTFKPGDCFVVPANTQHAVENSGPVEAELLFVRILSHA